MTLRSIISDLKHQKKITNDWENPVLSFKHSDLLFDSEEEEYFQKQKGHQMNLDTFKNLKISCIDHLTPYEEKMKSQSIQNKTLFNPNKIPYSFSNISNASIMLSSLSDQHNENNQKLHLQPSANGRLLQTAYVHNDNVKNNV